MRRYVTDRYGMISSADIADALRRAEARAREEERLRREREARRLRRRTQLRHVLPFFAGREPKPAH